MKNKDKKNKHVFKDNLQTIIIGSLTILIVIIVIIYNNINTKKIYTVVNGHVEKISDVTLYVLKNEEVINIDNNMAAVPIVEQDKRVAKDEIIAIYKNSEYDKYLEQVDSLDKEIQTLIADLPVTYSNDVRNIDEQIAKLVKEANKTTSYVKMQEYKNNIDNLSYKKVSILGQLSPVGSKIRELIEQREKLEENKKNLGNSIKATKAGLVTYKIDTLENVVDYNKIFSYNANDFDDIISKYSTNSVNDFGIKIIDNFSCYLLVKEPKGENEEYIKEGKNYSIKLLDKTSNNIVCTLVKSIKTDEYSYNLFSINNSIENIVENRAINAEVIWTKAEGMAVPRDAIYKNEEKGYDYVTLITGGEYTNVPVKVKISDDNLCIVENLSKEEREQLSIDTDYILEIYDRLLVLSGS